MTKEELAEWQNDYDGEQLSSGAFILYLKLHIADFEKEYEELEYKLGCILDTVTGGCISKPHTDKSAIDEAIHKQVMKEWIEAIRDYKENQEDCTIENTICKWTRDIDVRSLFHTRCSDSFQLCEDEEILDDDFKFCPYCGGEIEIDAE